MAWEVDFGKFEKLNIGGETMKQQSPKASKAKAYKPKKTGKGSSASMISGARTSGGKSYGWISSATRKAQKGRMKQQKQNIRAIITRDARALRMDVKATKGRGAHKGMWRSNITGNYYSSKEAALQAGYNAKYRAEHRRYSNPELQEYYEEKLKSRQESYEAQKAKREEKARLKQEIEERNARMEQALKEMDEFEYNEDEWEEVQNRPEEKPQVTGDLWVTWDSVKHGLIGNKWYWMHETGSWLYSQGYHEWNLIELIKDPYWTSELDNHTNLEFVEQALKDSPLGMQYEIAEDKNGVPYIAHK
jgi:hypothetical protein